MPNDDEVNLAYSFKAHLTAAGLSKAELARRCNLSPVTVSRWKNSPPPIVKLYLDLKASVRKIAA